MAHFRKLVGSRCYLSPCAPEDAPLFAQWLNDPDVAVPLGDEAYHTLSTEAFQADIDDSLRRQDAIFTIVDLESDCAIGRCLLFAVDHIDRSAMIGLFIGDKTFWGKGYGQEAMQLLLEYAFDLLNLNSVMLGVFEFNHRAIHAYEKLGFRVIGRRREARFIGGKAYDGILMDMLASELERKYLTAHLPGLEV
jgi:RimJ/RimL family protein N-acetyltransferase